MKKKKPSDVQNAKSEKKKQRIATKNAAIVCIIVAAALLTAGIISYFGDKKGDNSANQGSMATSTSTLTQGSQIECAFHRKLDGVCVPSEADINPPIVGVMVENALDAQPLSGVSHASIVYEAPAEGTIPRFLTIFPLTEAVDQVGPIRSARPYYIDWLSEYGDAMYMHVGGSPEALQKIQQYDIFSINEFFHGKSFWRSKDRVAPHNTYTSTDLWSTAHEKNIEHFQNDQYIGWQYEAREKCTSECVKNISIAFSPAYNLKWVYQEETGKYERLQNGRVHKDSDGQPYVFDNIILQHVNIAVIDEVGRKKITTIGEGKAEIFVRGYKIEGTWKKESRTGRTQWFDGSGQEVKLAPGKTWVEMVGTVMSTSLE